LASLVIPGISLAQGPLPPEMRAVQDEKARRTPEERKLDTQLLFLSRESAGRRAVEGAPSLKSRVEREADGRVKVDIAAAPSAELRQAITAAGGSIIYESPRFQSVTASVPPAAIAGLAARTDVQRITQGVEAIAHTGSVTNQADLANRADVARATYGVNGSGITVGVLSTSDDHSEASIASGDLPADFAVLPGQSGRPNSGEGTAMSEIVHDIAPGAKIIFSTGGPSKAAFGDNIIALHQAGAQIIVDDLTYGGEWQFQDDEIGQAINQVVADGALYFSAAGNEGNLRNGTAPVWEGDFVDGGVNPLIPGGTVHSFGGQTYNRILADSSISLQWSDEYHTSASEYDLYVLSADGTSVVAASTNTQDGNDEPSEFIPVVHAGERIVIFRFGSTPARYLRLFTGSSPLEIGTTGEIVGHSATANSIAVAASNAVDAVNNPPGYFTTASQAEPFSSDGPHKMFYYQDGTPITPGNFLASGGVTLQQPILTVGDCGATSVPVPGLDLFCGTSAAAPAAAAITALVWSRNLSLTNTQVRAILGASLLDIQDPGFDVNTGNGILMADLAVANTPTPGFPSTGVLDNFNRANGAVGSNWTGTTGTSFYKIASNRLDVQLGGPLLWKPSSFGTSQEAFVKLSTIDSRSPSQGLLLKAQSSAMDAGAITVVYDAKAKAVRVSALRLGQNGAWTLYPNRAATFANGDVLGARARANGKVEIYKNGTLITTVTLSTKDQAFFNAKGGKIGIWTAAASNALFDDFGGGTVLP
jgi:hypothetical protein